MKPAIAEQAARPARWCFWSGRFVCPRLHVHHGFALRQAGVMISGAGAPGCYSFGLKTVCGDIATTLPQKRAEMTYWLHMDAVEYRFEDVPADRPADGEIRLAHERRQLQRTWAPSVLAAVTQTACRSDFYSGLVQVFTPPPPNNTNIICRRCAFAPAFVSSLFSYSQHDPSGHLGRGLGPARGGHIHRLPCAAASADRRQLGRSTGEAGLDASCGQGAQSCY